MGQRGAALAGLGGAPHRIEQPVADGDPRTAVVRDVRHGQLPPRRAVPFQHGGSVHTVGRAVLIAGPDGHEPAAGPDELPLGEAERVGRASLPAVLVGQEVPVTGARCGGKTHRSPVHTGSPVMSREGPRASTRCRSPGRGPAAFVPGPGRSSAQRPAPVGRSRRSLRRRMPWASRGVVATRRWRGPALRRRPGGSRGIEAVGAPAALRGIAAAQHDELGPGPHPGRGDTSGQRALWQLGPPTG